jgi:TRAP-type mannitol/chloroaromatic compound transport system permease small subunit
MIQSLLLTIDRISTWFGKIFAWSILVLTLAVGYEVFTRYVFRAPTSWGYDASYMLYGLLFMTAGAYTLARNGHVRGDFIYRTFPPRGQAWMDLVLYILFFFPGMLAFVYSGWSYFHMSWMFNEHSSFSPAGPPLYPFKFLIPLVGCFMILQGIAEVIRAVICIRTGRWPDRLHDVEELENEILARVQSERETGARA